MKKTLLVARHEFRRYVTRRGFLFAVLGLPLLLLLIMGIAIVIAISGEAEAIGVVDLSGRLMDPATFNEQLDEEDPVFVRFADEAVARQALENEEATAYFTVPDNYPDENQIVIYHLDQGELGIADDISSYLRANLIREAGVTQGEAQLLMQGGDLQTTFVNLRESGAEDPFGAFIFPFVVGFLLVMSTFTTGGYMLQSVVDEKENRTMEILVTSLRPEQLMTGKVLGLVALGLVQTAVWTAALVVVFLYSQSRWEFLQAVRFPPRLILVAIAWFLPFYIMMGSFMAAIGISVTEVSEGQQATSIISLLAVVPFWLLFILLDAPDGPISIALSLIPFTAPLSTLIRWPLTQIPLWQLAASWLILAASAGLALLLVGRLLRAGMLRYGQRLSLREIRGALRQGYK